MSAEPSSAPPIEEASPLSPELPELIKPSLVPDDIWDSYQQELADALREEQLVESEVDEFGENFEVITAEAELGLTTTTRADPEVALFALQKVELFDQLSNSALDILVREARQGEVGAGKYLFAEGDPANTFFVVIDGALEILRRRDDREVALRHIHAGEAIGIFGLFSGQLRAAGARAIGDVVVLEVPASALGRLFAETTELHDRMYGFYQERLLEGFLGSAKLFTDVDLIARARMIGRFTERHLRANETLVQPGEVANLLAVLMSGRFILEHRPKAGQEPQTFELLPGQYLAMTCAFSGAPSRMRIYAAEETTVAIIDHREFAELLRDYPGLRSLGARLPSVARAIDRDIYCGHTGVPGL